MTLTVKLTKEICLNCGLPLKHSYFHCTDSGYKGLAYGSVQIRQSTWVCTFSFTRIKKQNPLIKEQNLKFNIKLIHNCNLDTLKTLLQQGINSGFTQVMVLATLPRVESTEGTLHRLSGDHDALGSLSN